ncbi:MAG TPA: hypothetical protein VF211_04825 [Burkholderiales bacterium]
MRIALALCVALALGACAHADVALNSSHSSASGTSVTTGGAGLQINASGGLAAALAAGVIVAAAMSQPEDSDAWPRYRSLSEWFSGQPAPEMDPSRSVSEQDCSRPIAGSGNLKCR